LNDSEEELKGMAGFIADTGVEIPWHISRFHPDYKFTERPTTPIETLKQAEKLGKEAGLRHIHLGNI
ncbi:MAG: radical SAM protein, partial [Candidatus Omnitrophica bacterium]|nr:radical SAM protein [Candidatus Omnitrophota bacterium]